MGSRLARRQALTLTLLVVGYAGYYLCRSDLAVVKPLLKAEMVAEGATPAESQARLGDFDSFGTAAYASGKFFAGALGDFLGGRRNFLGGMAGAVAFTMAFASGRSGQILTMAWMGNRLSQSLGWAGMVKVVSRWFDYRSTGTVMGVVSLSYLFGDAASKLFLAFLIDRGLGWRSIFATCAAILGVWLVACFFLLRESPTELGLTEGEANPANVFGVEGEEARPSGLTSLLGPLLASRAFWYVGLLSMGLTLLRETFNNWTPTYFTQVVGLSPSRSAGFSALFPLWGGVAVILAGVLGDRLGRVGRGSVLVVGLTLTGLALWALGTLKPGVAPIWPIAGVTLVGFLLIGPYSYLAGSIAIDFGGKRGGATASGLIDGVGYLAGILAGGGVARLVSRQGWEATFSLLAGLAWVSAVVAGLYLWDQARRPR